MSRSYDTTVTAAEALERRDFELAESLYRKALDDARHEDQFSVWFVEGRLADALIQGGKAAEAREVLERSLASGSDIPASSGMLAQIYYATDDYDGLERLIRSRQGDLAKAVPPYYNGAGHLLSMAGRSVVLAEAGIEDNTPLVRAERIAHEVGNKDLEYAVRHRRGQVAEALGDIDGAIACYRTLTDEGSCHEDTVERLLGLLEKQGRAADALRLATRLSQSLGPGTLRDSVTKRAARLTKVAAKEPTTPRPKKEISRSTFGARVAACEVATEVLALEQDDGAGAQFVPLDDLTGRLLAARLADERIGTGMWNLDRIDLLRLTPADHALLSEQFSVERIEARGSWSIPEEINVPLRVLASNGDFDRAHSKVVGNPEAIYLWTLFVPLFAAIHAPLALRERITLRTAAQQKAEWQSVADLFARLDIDVRVEIDPMTYGGGWSRLKAAEREAAKARLTDALRTWAPQATTRYRALVIRDLARAYYSKADRDGRALRTRVVTATLRPAFIAYFGGDWLGFVGYLGEEVDPNEQVITALPEAKVLVAGAARATQAAAALGIPAAEAAKIANAYWAGSGGESPVEARVAALGRYWRGFDEVHERQAKGMPSLWGLVEEGVVTVDTDPFDDGRINPQAFLRTLPDGLLSEVERLWGRVMVPSHPNVTVSSASPHLLVAETLGPALQFWHGIALTAWFICEGPYSRTSLEDAQTYYTRVLAALDELGTPVDRTLFSDLLAAKRHLRPRPRDDEHVSSVEVAKGVSITLTMSIGPGKQDGFEHLRDVITRHRRAWAAEYLERYLHSRWDHGTRGASVVYQRLLSDVGKPPSIKAFARKVAPVVNEWFAGDISLLYAAIGERCPSPVTAAPRILPADPNAFVRALAAVLPEFPGGASTDDAAKWERNAKAADIGRFALRWIQIWELLGHEPTLDEAGRDVFMNAQTIRLRGENFREHRLFGVDPGEGYAAFLRLATDALKRSETTAQPETSGRSASGDRPKTSATDPTVRPATLNVSSSAVAPEPSAAPSRKGLFGRLGSLVDRSRRPSSRDR